MARIVQDPWPADNDHFRNSRAVLQNISSIDLKPSPITPKPTTEVGEAMRTLLRFCLALALGLGVFAAPVHAGFLYMADEDGNGIWAFRILDFYAVHRFHGGRAIWRIPLRANRTGCLGLSHCRQRQPDTGGHTFSVGILAPCNGGRPCTRVDFGGATVKPPGLTLGCPEQPRYHAALLRVPAVSEQY